MGTRRLSVTLLLALAAGCGPKIDPLTELKAEMAAVRATEPQATVVLDDVALTDMAAALLGRPYTAPGPLGMAVLVIPDIERAAVRVLGEGDDVTVDLEIDGLVDIAFPLASQDDLAFEGHLQARLVASVRPDSAGSWVLLGWPPGQDVRAEVALPGAPKQLAALTTGLVQGALSGALAEPKGALIPNTPWGPITNVTLGARDGDLLAFVTVPGAPGVRADPVTPPPGGFAVVLGEESVLGLLQGLAATGQEAETYVVEPLSVSFTGELVHAELRVHKRARRERWRRYRVTGPVVWQAGHLRVDAPALDLVDAQGWRKGLSVAVGEARALSALQEGIGGLPTALAQPLTADLALHIEVSDVHASDGKLVVSGPVEVVARPPPPPVP